MQHGWTLYVRAMAQNMTQMRMGATAPNIRKASVQMGAKAQNEGMNIKVHMGAKAQSLKIMVHLGATAQNVKMHRRAKARNTDMAYGMHGHLGDLG